VHLAIKTKPFYSDSNFGEMIAKFATDLGLDPLNLPSYSVGGSA
jgi:hypothetical protein